MASIVRPGAGADGGGGDDVDLRAELADDQVRYSDKIFAVIFSARFGERLSDSSLWCAYHGCWHGGDSFSLAQRLAPRERRYCLALSAPASRQTIRPQTQPDGAACKVHWHSALGARGKALLAAFDGDGAQAEAPFLQHWDAADNERRDKSNGISLRDVK